MDLFADQDSRRDVASRLPCYIDESIDVQRASTLPPTEPISAIAPTMINPAIRAYSRTSPPFSSRTNWFNRFRMVISIDRPRPDLEPRTLVAPSRFVNRQARA